MLPCLAPIIFLAIIAIFLVVAMRKDVVAKKPNISDPRCDICGKELDIRHEITVQYKLGTKLIVSCSSCLKDVKTWLENEKEPLPRGVRKEKDDRPSYWNNLINGFVCPHCRKIPSTQTMGRDAFWFSINDRLYLELCKYCFKEFQEYINKKYGKLNIYPPFTMPLL